MRDHPGRYIDPLEPRTLLAAAVLLKDIWPGPDDSKPRAFTTVGQQVFFFADDPAGGGGLYKTAGTAATTTRFTNAGLNTDPARNQRDASPDKLFYLGELQPGVRKLFRSD